jgi:hypothetical protein
MGYNRNSQNILQISNTTFSTPFDIWYPSTPKVKPQFSDIISAGYFLELKQHKYSVSLETYYKKMRDVVDLKDHANTLGNPFFEDELSFGKGRSYGVEFEAKKNEGKITGWLSYTYSRSLLKIKAINDGKEYPTTYDVPHDLSIGMGYQLSKRLSMSATWVYSTGAATMLMAGYYKYMDLGVPYYAGKNAGRLPDYHRLDLGLSLITKRTIKREAQGKQYHATWNFSIINVYNRTNPYYIVLRPDRENSSLTNIDKVYLLGLFPSVTYNFKF